jgi:hypothetical protein
MNPSNSCRTLIKRWLTLPGATTNRPDNDFYLENGYVPDQVAWTLDNSYYDFTGQCTRSGRSIKFQRTLQISSYCGMEEIHSMKLIRFGEPGKEKSGVILDNQILVDPLASW